MYVGCAHVFVGDGGGCWLLWWMVLRSMYGRPSRTADGERKGGSLKRAFAKRCSPVTGVVHTNVLRLYISVSVPNACLDVRPKYKYIVKGADSSAPHNKPLEYVPSARVGVPLRGAKSSRV